MSIKEKVDELENRIFIKLGKPKNFISYVQKYEFESLLLSDSSVLATYFNKPAMKKDIDEALKLAGSAEDVNDSAETAPSKRIEQWTLKHKVQNKFNQKTKVLHGLGITQKLTLPVIRQACPRFNDWITRLESLKTNLMQH
jgi:hypothetical protein